MGAALSADVDAPTEPRHYLSLKTKPSTGANLCASNVIGVSPSTKKWPGESVSTATASIVPDSALSKGYEVGSLAWMQTSHAVSNRSFSCTF